MPLQHILAILLVNLAWGSGFLALKLNVIHFGPYFSLSIRYTCLSLLLFPFLRRIQTGQLPMLLTVASLMGVLHFGLGMTSFHLAADVSSMAIAAQSYIPLSAFLAFLILKEAMPWTVALGIALSFGGLVVMSFDPLIFEQLDAMLAMLASALVLAICSLLVRRKLPNIHPLTLQGWIGVCGVLPMFLLSMGVEERQWQRLSDATWLNWLSVGHAVVVSSILGHGVNFWLLQRQPVARVTPFYLLTPLVGVASAVAFWGDEPGPRVFAGGAMILLGILLVSQRGGWRWSRKT